MSGKLWCVREENFARVRRVSFGEGLLTGEILEIAEEGNRLIKFHYDGIFQEILDQLGQMPLPPYIKHQLKERERLRYSLCGT